MFLPALSNTRQCRSRLLVRGTNSEFCQNFPKIIEISGGSRMSQTGGGGANP